MELTFDMFPRRMGIPEKLAKVSRKTAKMFGRARVFFVTRLEHLVFELQQIGIGHGYDSRSSHFNGQAASSR
jgi:hypothetical protein